MIIAERLPADATFVIFFALLMCVIGGVALTLAMQRLRRSQLAAYYVLRKSQRIAALKLLRIAAMIIAVGAAFMVYAFMLPYSSRVVATELGTVLEAIVGTPEPTPYVRPTPAPNPPTATAVPPTATSEPSATALPSSTPSPTETPKPTEVISKTLTPLAVATQPSIFTPTPVPLDRTTPRATPLPRPTNAQRKLSLNTLAPAYDAKEQPVGGGTEFIAGTKVIFLFFDFANLPADLPIQHIWQLNGANLAVQRTVWNRAGSGTGFVSFAPPGGFGPGLYQVRVLLDTDPMFVANFLVK